MRVGGWMLALVVGLSGMARAAPLDMGQISAEATWVAHLDLDALGSSVVVQRLAEAVLKSNKGLAAHLELLRSQIGLDLRKDLHGITAYGRKIGKNDGVLLIHADVDQKLLFEKVVRSADHKTTAYLRYELHSWTDAKGKPTAHLVCGAFYRPTLTLVAPSIEDLKAAVDVLDGRSPGLKGKDSPLAAPIPGGAAVIARAMGLADAKLPFKSPLVTQSETFSLVLGEHQGASFAEAKLTTKTADVAVRVKSLLEGVRALALLERGDDPETVRLIEQCQVQVNGKTVSAQFRAPVEEVWKQLEKDWRRATSTPGSGPASGGAAK